MLNRKFVAGITYNRKKEKPEIDNLYSHLKDLAKEEQNKSKASRRKDIIKEEQISIKLKTEKNQ